MPDHIITTMDPRQEATVATIEFRNDDGQGTYLGALHVGYYSDLTNDEAELWVEQEGKRVQLPASALKELIIQLRRAVKINGERHAS